ncbi:MAG: tRNA (adenosine(37)-N6)-dimethylallyltransferase, partial [Sphingopyxis sp.]
MASPSFSTASARPPVALIAGPTASGKSALAVALAKSLSETGRDAIVVNADASQVYADLRILSARPTGEEMEGIDHRLFGHINAAEAHNAVRWADEARGVIAEAHAAGQVPILVGGTGLHMRTLLHGIAPVPEIDPGIREAVRALPVADAHAALAAADAGAAARLNP